MSSSISASEYQRIAAEIVSEDSPVGIDATKTHVMILAKLESLERRLERIETQLAGGVSGPPAAGSSRPGDR